MVTVVNDPNKFDSFVVIGSTEFPNPVYRPPRLGGKLLYKDLKLVIHFDS